MLYFLLNLTFCTTLLVGSSIGGGSLDQFPYVALLFAICSSPLPFVDRLNGTFTMLGVAMAVYFVEFGALDAKYMLQPPANFAGTDQGISRTDLFLLVGAVMQIVGFHWAARITTMRSSRVSPKDWSARLFVPIGVALWSCAAAATLYRAFVVQQDNSALSIQEGLERLGVWRATGLMLMGNYAGPLGIMILAYWWAVWNKRLATPLLLILMFAQFAVGWVVDTKEVAISAPVIALLTRFLIVGKMPLRWLIGSMLAILLVFPIMSAKRVIMTEELPLDPGSGAAAHLRHPDAYPPGEGRDKYGQVRAKLGNVPAARIGQRQRAPHRRGHRIRSTRIQERLDARTPALCLDSARHLVRQTQRERGPAPEP